MEDGTGVADLGEKLFNQVTPRSELVTVFPSLTTFLVVSRSQKYPQSRLSYQNLRTCCPCRQSVTHVYALEKTGFHDSTHTAFYSAALSFSKEFLPPLSLHSGSHRSPWPLNKV